MDLSKINTRFDFRKDTPYGKDPDSWSPTLRRYHKALWSRELPSGKVLTLRDDVPGRYLSHESSMGSFSFSSDSVIPTYLRWKRMQPIVSQAPFWKTQGIDRRCYTIGGMMIWPSTNVPGVGTINGMRGLNGRISDRFDLTLECVRRYYSGVSSPLSLVLDANAAFFELFEDFDGFVGFFLLEDLINDRDNTVRFMIQFDDFEGTGRPRSLTEYMEYMDNADAFVKARNRRISALSLQA